MMIKGKELKIPIIQGGMGVGVSLGNLAGTVAFNEGMGIISTVNAGYREDDFLTEGNKTNQKALANEISKAKTIAQGKGLIGINIMVATTNYVETVKTAIEAGIDTIISGAGLPMELPELAKGKSVAIAPIVSSGKAAKIICKSWDRKSGTVPDFIVIEGSEAGGHLGFTNDELVNHTAKTLSEILKEVLVEIKPFEEKYKRSIPVFVAGGVYSGKDMAEYQKEGAAGVQIGTRFIATNECDASLAYKNEIIQSTKETIEIVKSPVGMPGRAISTPLIQKLRDGARFPAPKCINCLIPCNPAETPYCISHALIEAAKGNLEEGLFFCGANAWKIDRMYSVEELMNEIVTECKKEGGNFGE